MKKIAVSLWVFCVAVAAAGAADYSWQEPHARVLPSGDLAWAPKPFVYEPGKSVRYIDFENGRDANDGQTRETAWKHHPGDPRAGDLARNGGDADTYIFKRGVVYRGNIVLEQSGTAEAPVRLTSDPAWGEGEAVISGADMVTGWKQGASHPDIPQPEKIWYADLDFAPRNLWMTASDGTVTRIPIARTPNWTVSDPEDVLSEWWEWEQPRWWEHKNKVTVEGKKIHLGIDTRHLTASPETYEDAILWTEWGIVMGTPFPTKVQAVDPEKKALAFQGIWFSDTGVIITRNRYYLEDKPHFLDAPGEHWFEKKNGGGRLYVRLPGDIDPSTVTVEAARRYSLVEDRASARAPMRLDVIGDAGRAGLDTTGVRHVEICGLSFRFMNRWWDLEYPTWRHKEVDPAAIRLRGSCRNVRVSNCRFQHVVQAVQVGPVNSKTRSDTIAVTDNDIRYTDDTAIAITSAQGSLGSGVDVLRNRLWMIGMRPSRQSSGHALCVNFPSTMEIAGNMFERCYGSGIFLFGGKGSGSPGDAPLARYLVHQNKVEQALLAANDWGAIETWQGGPFYVFNNIAGNPNGYWNWSYNPDKPNSARLGYAYYLDGSYKNYHFNNIAWGASNDLTSKHCNNTAFYHATPTMLNQFFNNTAYNFADGTGWSPVGGRQFFLGNLWLSISRQVFHHTKQKEDKDAVYDDYPHHTIAYSRNVFHDIGGTVGCLEGSGSGDADLDSFRKAMIARKLLATDVGVMSDAPVVRDAAGHDFRPAEGSDALNRGVKVFVPWALSRMVGEWNFRCNNADPSVVLDDHWYMSPQVSTRDMYRKTPRYDLKAVNVAASDYTSGPLENWAAGALTLNGRDQYLVLASTKASADAPVVAADARATEKPADWLEVDVPRDVVPGTPFDIKVRLPGARAGQKLVAHLHWLKTDGWGGFMTLGQPMVQEVKGEGPYTFTFKPEDKNGLDAFSLLVALTPTGEWNDKTADATIRLAKGEPAAPASDAFPTPHDADRNFCVETYFRTEPGHTGGTLVCDLDQRGYQLSIGDQGGVTFAVQADGKAAVSTDVIVNDGAWHHVIAEADRGSDLLRVYVDGTLAAEAAARLKGSSANRSDLLVGKSPSGDFLAGAIEFLRISLGTLADAETTIEELCAWQFDGPFLRDFTGRLPRDGQRDAGAIEAQ